MAVSSRPVVHLPPALASYQARSPGKEERAREGIDGSELELQIVSFLVNNACSDDQIIEYFANARLPRHSEEIERSGSDSWLRSLIKTARSSHNSYVESLEDHEINTNLNNNTNVLMESDHNRVDDLDERKRSHDDPGLPHYVLKERLLAEERGEEAPILSAWREEIRVVSGRGLTKPVSAKTAQRLSNDLCEFGYVRFEPIDGKRKAVYLTEKGRKGARPALGKWGRSILLRPYTAQTPPDVGEIVAEESQERTCSRRRPKGGAKAKPQTREAHFQEQRKHEMLNGQPRIAFRGNRIRYIQLLTPTSEWEFALVWKQLCVGYDAEGVPLYQTVISPADPAIRMDDPLTEHVPWQAHGQGFAAAVELIRSPDGQFEVAQFADEHGESQPKAGILMQSWFNFFRPLDAANLDGQIIRVKGTGSGKERRYHFEEAGVALPLSLTFNFESFLAELGDEERLQEILALPRGWFHMPPKRQQLLQTLGLVPTPERKGVAR